MLKVDDEERHALKADEVREVVKKRNLETGGQEQMCFESRRRYAEYDQVVLPLPCQRACPSTALDA